MGKKFGMSFSWKRAVGISSAKARFARATGIPTTRQGRQRKAGAAMGCMIPIVCMIGILILCSCGKSKEPDFGLMQQKLIESRLTYKSSRTDYSRKIAEAKQKISDAKEKYKDDPELLKSCIKTYQLLIKTYQAAEETNKKTAAESPEQIRKAAFVEIHIRYAALQDSAARKEFMKMINDPDVFQGKGAQSVLIMKYPAYVKEVNRKEYAERANNLTRDLNLTVQVGVLTYDNVSDLEKAYDIVKKLY
ncbi:MAG: hypothetical protein J5787_03760 [Alphaproteobacteria bacterium]|nr:hypothetical protein [Alphaproteobacteria bacterium]